MSDQPAQIPIRSEYLHGTFPEEQQRLAQDKIVPWGLLQAGSFDEGVANLQAWKRRPDAAMWFAIAWAEGVRCL